MGWYAASIIIYTKFKDGIQDKFPFYENVILIEAPSPEEAFEKAVIRGKEDEGDSEGTYYYDDRPATFVFAGIRKIIECQNANDKPVDGTEITYSSMIISEEEAFSRLLKGEGVSVFYEE